MAADGRGLVERLADIAAMRLDARSARRLLIGWAVGGLLLGLVAQLMERPDFARAVWIAATLPVVAAIALAIRRDLRAGRLGVDAIALIAMSAAIGLGEALAGAVVAVMYAGGNALEDYAVGRAERELKALLDRTPRVAHRFGVASSGDAGLADIPVESVAVGDRLLVRGGEVVPVDGLILGSADAPPASIDESALTGEPLPVTRRVGEGVASGTVNAGDSFEMSATATADDSTYAGVVRMVAAAQTAKAPFVRMADRFALLLLPVALAVAGVAWLASGDVTRALAVLLAATPCPLILAAPVAFIAGVSRAAHLGILVKGGGALEALARTETVVLDKTGTLTVGGARLVAVETPAGEDADEVLRLAASIEQSSHHVVARAIVAAARARGLELSSPNDVREAHGTGLEGALGGRRVRVGAQAYVCGPGRLEPWAARAIRRAAWRAALTVFVAVDGRPVGVLLLADEIRRDAPQALRRLREAGVTRIVMLTGDRADAAEAIAAALDIDAVLAERAPADKLEAVVAEKQRRPTLMVGDGINDAPALAAADVGIALGARGASASSEAADVVIAVDRLDRVADAVVISRRTRGIALQSIVVGMALSGLAMLGAALGWITPVAAAVTQEGIDVAVIFNALRALGPDRSRPAGSLPADRADALRREHADIEPALARLRAIADELDDAGFGDAGLDRAGPLIREAGQLVGDRIVRHEQADERDVYPDLQRRLSSGDAGLGAMRRAHREILHLARLLQRLIDGLEPDQVDRFLVRDAQRILVAIDALVRLHNAQEDDIYEQAAH